jgi:hypothetical protein
MALLALGSCIGSIGGGAGETISDEAAAQVGVSGMRRLSVAEYQQTVIDLLGLEAPNAREILPVDTLVPFDNDYTLQTPSEALVKGAELLAGDVAMAVVADATLRATVVGCEPSGPADAGCFRSFVERFGRRALRRPLDAAEIDRFAGLLDVAVTAGDFWAGVEAALRAFLPHPELLYRIEIGDAVAGHPELRKLNDYEIATRLSYFLVGSTTPDWLLDVAQSGGLASDDGLAAAAAKLLADDRARARINRFHGMWLSYATLSEQGVFGDMHRETDALVERVVFDEQRPWTDVLTSEETFLTPELAEHYGLPAPGTEAGWVAYGDSGRKGLLSHGTFLSAVAKFGDTSPTQRGLLIRTRLFCETIEKPPPDLQVNVDMPPMAPDPDACKRERYFMSTDPRCSACHKLMDPIGFGLENYDPTGRYREHEVDRPECVIDGEGDFAGVGGFNGPAELADLAVETGRVEACVARQLYRFAVGRMDVDEHDDALIANVVGAASAGGLRLDAFIVGYVTSEAFRFRREEAVP